MLTIAWIILFLAAAWILAYNRASLRVLTISFLLLIVLHDKFARGHHWLLATETLVFLAIVAILNIPLLRQLLFTRAFFAIYHKLMPHMSRTEREALQAGTVGWEGDLFAGMPDWQKLLALAPGKLSAEELAFINGPVDEVCRLTDDWDITHNRGDLPPELWQYLKEQGFFGLIIPKQYGGKEFSAFAHLAILTKLYGRSVTVATTVNVPNSLGPAELILRYGTEQQKNYYLPRLAKGEEIPCFALTSPEAGSDAGAIPDTGIICRGQFEGKEIVGIRLNWNKRYITLAPVATLLGLAFKLFDPEHLLGAQTDLGITCALIPTHTPGIQIGRRHFPLNAVFQNGPTQGKDVFIPLDWIIGGAKMAGHGWQMLMECLATGRAISLPASSIGGAKVATHATGAYAHIRKQFNLPIGQFEGVQATLARMGAYTYLLDAAVKFTVAAIDRGEQPAVTSAIMKYHATERSRQVANDAMDIHGGKGICLGPHNYIARNYETLPIGITVEGANILTRSLIIFGQGAIRCHPYLLIEMTAAQNNDLKLFDKAIFAHIGFTISNTFRTLFLGLTAAIGVRAPQSRAKRFYQQFTRFSSAFALIADCSMLAIGSDLKRKERLSARLGDILSMLYLGSATLKHYAEQNEPEADWPFVEWICRDLLYTIQQSFDGLLHNYPAKILAGFLRVLIFPFGKSFTEPNDRLGQRVAELLLTPNESRARLTQGAYLAADPNNMLYQLDQALVQIIATEALEKQLYQALHAKQITILDLAQQIEAGLAHNILTPIEAEQLRATDLARKAIIAVDDFGRDELARQAYFCD